MSWIPAEASHIPLIAARCRQADVDEVWASDRMTPAEAMAKGLELATAWTGVLDGVPVCMFGVTPLCVLGAVGVPWMIGTTDIRPKATSFQRESREALKMMKGSFERLVNFVDARNVEAVRWLRRLGFEIKDAIPYGPDGLPFHPFEWRRA